MDSLAIRTRAWAVLAGATLCSAWAVSHVSGQAALVGVIMTLATAKALLVLHRFMDLGALPLPLRWLFRGWAVGCGAMILAFAVLT